MKTANNCFNLTIAVDTKSAGRYRSPALFAPSLRLQLRPQLQVKQMLGGRAVARAIRTWKTGSLIRPGIFAIL